MSNWIGNVELGVIIDKKNVTNELLGIFKNCQSEADKHNITYKIAGDKSSIETMLKQIQGLTPELLTKMTLNFDKSDFDKEMNILRSMSGKTAAQIGEEFKSSIQGSLKGFSISEFLGGKKINKDNLLNVKDIAKLKEPLQNLMNQTGSFDLSKVTSVKEINDQVIALNKMQMILESLHKYSDQKAIKIDGNTLNIAETLQQNSSQIESIMGNVGDVIKTNASQWATTLETTFNSEFNGIINLLNNLQEVISGVLGGGTGSGGSGGGTSREFENLKTQIEQTTKEIETLEAKLLELQKTKSSTATSSASIESLRNQIIKAYPSANEDYIWDGKGKNITNFKDLVNQFMQLGGQIKDLTLGSRQLAEKLKITQIVPPNVTQEIENTTKALEEARRKKEELLGQQQALSSSSGVTTGVGTGTSSTGQSSTSDQGVVTSATVSPKISPSFKEDLQSQVDSLGAVSATVTGKVSDSFLSDVQTSADTIGSVKVGVDFRQKEGGESQNIPVNVSATPQLSETFRDELQQLIDSTGKYSVSIGANEGKQSDPLLIKAAVENGEGFRSELKQIIEGENGLSVKVNPIIDKDYKLEINSAVLKDVKVEGTISGGNLKPDSVDTSTSGSSTSSEQEKVQEGLTKTKEKQKEVGKAAQESANVQKRSLLEVVKEIQKVEAEQEKLMQLNDSLSSSNGISQFVAQKKAQAQEYANIQELIAKIQSKMSESTSKSASTEDITKHFAGIVAYVERLRELLGSAFSYDVLGQNGEEAFNRMKTTVDQASNGMGNINQEIRNFNQQLITLRSEQSSLEQTATSAEKLELKLYSLVQNLEALKAQGKNGDLININSKSFKDFFDLWMQYKNSGGTRGISDFTNEAKVINSVEKAYNGLIVKEKELAAERSAKADRLKTTFSVFNTDIDMNQFNSIFEQIKSGALTAEQATARLEAAIKALRAEASKPVENTNPTGTAGTQAQVQAQTKTEKSVKLDTKAEMDVVPKVEDPASFASQVTQQIAGHSAVIDVKPNIVWENAKINNISNAGINNAVNTEIDQNSEYYNRMIGFMKEYIELQKIIEKGNKYIKQGVYINGSDLRDSRPTQVSIKRQLNEYLTRKDNGYSEKSIMNSKETLASYVHAFNNADKAQQIFGRNNKALFTEIQTMIENSKASLDAFQTSQAKYSGMLHNASKISEKANLTFGQRGTFESILQTGDIEQSVQFLQEHLGLKIPAAAQQAKTAIDGIGEQAQQEGQEIKGVNIQVPLEANIESLNASIQSQKDKILPVDVKLNATSITTSTGGTNASTDVGTTGMANEAQQAEALRGKIEQITVAVDNKTNAFRQEEQVVVGTVQREITSLEALDGQLLIILDTLQKIAKNPINIKGGSENVNTQFLDDLKNSLNGLDPELLKNLGETLKSFNIKESVATNIQKLANAILNLKSNLNNVSPSSNEFLNSIKELVSQGESLKNLATVLNATKAQIQQAKAAMADASATKAPSDTSTSNEMKEAKSNVDLVTKAYNNLISTEQEYQRLKAKVDIGTATKREAENFNSLTVQREKDNAVIREATNLTKEQLELQKQYQKEVANGVGTYNNTLDRTRVLDVNTAYDEATRINTALNNTKQLMNQAFNPNIAGFQSVFDRAQAEVDELNQKLMQGNISNIQTGYTDKINGIVSSLNKVVAVAEPGDINAANQAMLQYASTLNNGNVKIGNFTNSNKTLTASFETQKGVMQQVALTFNETTGAITMMNKGTKQMQSTWSSFVGGLKARFQSLLQYLSIFVSYYRIIAIIRQGITYIKELDTALTEMRKVSDETVSSLKEYQDASFDVAKSVGTTAKQIQDSTADWMRLGESMEEAAESARVANILMNVSEFESIDDATESLVSMSAAYDELTKTDIIDKLNEVGNNYSIATDGLAVALQKSASALTTAGNDMDEAVALLTAGNAVVQDADVVGTGMQTIALRLVGTKEAKDQLEELGEDTDDVITTTSKLRDTILSATAVASNEYKGFDILDENGNYKSTYEIMLGLSDIYKEIVETDKKFGNNNLNLLLETIAGKRRANIAASILQNEDLLTSVYDSSANDSEGSAQQELDKYLDSIEGKIQLFNNEVQEFWYGLIDSETVKGFISAGTSIIDIIGKMTSEFGLLGTAVTAFATAFSVHAALKGGGRVKKFTLIAKYATESFSREVCEIKVNVHWYANI